MTTRVKENGPRWSMWTNGNPLRTFILNEYGMHVPFVYKIKIQGKEICSTNPKKVAKGLSLPDMEAEVAFFRFIAICDEVGRVKRDERGLATIKRVKGNDNKFETEVIEKRVSVYPLTMKKLQEFRREQEDAKEKGVKYKKVF